MNTNPDEVDLALWLDDELTGDELTVVEAWVASRPEQLAAREDVRRWRLHVAAAVPAVEEPPYPDFFNSRILQAIRETPAPRAVVKPSIWRSWLMPVAACAAVMLAFWIGKRSGAERFDMGNAPRAIPVQGSVYAPESGVDAEVISGSKTSETVIVLTGVAAIPDTMEFPDSSYTPLRRDIDSTAAIGSASELNP